MFDHPLRGGRTVVESGRERMRAVRASRVAELDADHDHAGGGEMVAPQRVVRVAGLQDRHAAAVGVHDARQRPVCVVGCVDVERDVVAVDAGDRLGARAHAGDRFRAVGHDTAECVEAGLGFDPVGEQFVHRRRRGDRWRRWGDVHADRRQRRYEARVGTRIGTDVHLRVAEAAGKSGRRGHGCSDRW